jgi:hypothetical protein
VSVPVLFEIEVGMLKLTAPIGTLSTRKIAGDQLTAFQTLPEILCTLSAVQLGVLFSILRAISPAPWS